MTGFALGQRSLSNITVLHPDVARVVKAAIERSATDFGVPEKCGRTAAEQAEKVRLGVSKTLHSRHLIQADGFSHAVDLVPWVDGAFSWKLSGPFYSIALAMHDAANAEGVRLIWGGNWNRDLNSMVGSIDGLKAAVTDYCQEHPGPDFVDLPHYELAS